MQFLSLDKLAEAILSWQTGHELAANDATRTLVLTGPADKATIVFAANGLPQSIEVSDEGGLREKYQLSEMRLNTGLAARDFDPANPAYGFPGYSAGGIFIAPERMNTALNQSWARIKDYTCVLFKQERLKGKLQDKNTVSLKFRKPGDIYLKWIKQPHEGRELIYRQGKDDKMLVHEGGMLRVAALKLDLDSPLVKMDTTHRLTELDIGYMLKMIYDNLYRGLKNGDVTLQFKGGGDQGGRLVYTVESRFANAAAQRYYAPRTVISHDVITGLPLKVVNYDAAGQLLEEFEWSQIRFNVGLTDMDFDYRNPNYKF
jgi:outer membrane lipoprotein-sorting protein